MHRCQRLVRFRGSARSSFTICDNAISICNFSAGEAVRAFLISSINCSRCVAVSWGVRVVSYLSSLPRLDRYSGFRYGHQDAESSKSCFS